MSLENDTINENSEDIIEIITAVPSWILRWGITLIFSVLTLVILLSALIKYPDLVKINLKVNSLNAPKPVLAKQSGKLTKLLVDDGQIVKLNQPLAYFESIADPESVLQINRQLKTFQKRVLSNVDEEIELPIDLNLGEVQSDYQSFFQQYLRYKSTIKNGFYLDKIVFLKRDLQRINEMKTQLIRQVNIQKLEYANIEQEYKAYQKLFNNKVISRSEFIQQENKFLSAKYPQQETKSALLNNSSIYAEKERELLDLNNTILEEQAKFIQSLNECITRCDSWILEHVLKAPISGKLSFAGVVQQNQNVLIGQEVFVVNPGSNKFFGEIQIPQYNIGKISQGQRVLIKLRGYPFEQYGMIRGRLTYISDVAYRDSVFLAKVSFDHFENKETTHKIKLRNGMQADVEIITDETSLLQRFFRNVVKIFR